MSRKLTATLLTAMALAAVPAAIAPVAQAEVCVGDAWRHVGIGGCTNVVGDVAGAAVAGAAVADVAAANRYGFAENYPVSEWPAFPGEAPCISPAGIPYYTPGNAPCY